MRVGFDVNGTHDVKFMDARKTGKIFTLCTAFLAREDALSASARTVYTEDIRDLLTQSGAALDQKASGESQRALSSEEVKALDKKSVALIKKIHRTMLYEFAESPAEATKWGFDVKQTGKRAGTILMPDGRAAIVGVLDRYAKTEKARPAAQRFTAPPLAEVQAVVDGLSTNVNTRGTARSQRVAATQQTLAAAARLLDLLQAAAVQIVVKQFDGKVTPELGEWGYEVVARSSAAHSSAARNKPVKPAPTA
jgi:hypothetical protein